MKKLLFIFLALLPTLCYADVTTEIINGRVRKTHTEVTVVEYDLDTRLANINRDIAQLEVELEELRAEKVLIEAEGK